MARIVQLESEQKEFRIQEEVKATYSVNIINSEKFFQIDTYGKSNRVNNNVPSQVIQINKKTALQLISILKAEFSI